MVARTGGSVRATMLDVARGRITARPMAQYLAARTRNAAADVLEDVLGVSCVPESSPMPGQPPSWCRGAGVLGVFGVVGVLGSVGAGTVVEGLSVCAEALNGFRTVSANAALAMPNAVMPVVTTFLIRCTLSLVVDSHGHHALRHIRRA